MSVLSLTFHNTDSVKEEWKTYMKNELLLMAENLMHVEKFLLSEVETEMINEGQNTNLLLVFDNAEKRNDFIDFELQNITERIEAKFGTNVMIFKTFLNPFGQRF